MGAVRDFIERHYLHFNAREVVDAAAAYERHIDAGGKMLMSLAGAMSTGELGVILARMIREGKVHAISCTGANLEEDVFNLVAHDEYQIVRSWRELSAADEKSLYDRGMNRVTDTCIPETVMRHVEARLLDRWQAAATAGERYTPAEFLWQVLDDPGLHEHYQVDPAHSWMVAAKDVGIPVYAPGWEDSTTGNIFAANVMRGRLPHHLCVKSGTEQFQDLIEWYLESHGDGARPSVGFFQIGGGIAGDFAICAVPVHHAGPQERGAVLGLLLPDHGCPALVRWLLGRTRQREDHVGQVGRRHAALRDQLGCGDRGAARLRLRAGRLRRATD